MTINSDETTSTIAVLEPPAIYATDVALGTFGAAVAGFLGGMFVFVANYFLIGRIGGEQVSPFLLSLIAFIAGSLTAGITMMLERMILPNKYARASTALGQSGLFLVVLYAVFTPVYLIVASTPHAAVAVFTAHILLSIAGTALIAEVLSSYRYVLLGVYATLLALAVSAGVSLAALISLGQSNRSLYALVGVMILANTLSACVRLGFGWIYGVMYRSAGIDPL